MIFLVISKFDAELVKNKCRYVRDNVKYGLFRHSRAITTSETPNIAKFRTHLIVYTCPGYQQV